MKKSIYVLLVVFMLGILGLGCVESDYIPVSARVSQLEKQMTQVQYDIKFNTAIESQIVSRLIPLESDIRTLKDKQFNQAQSSDDKMVLFYVFDSHGQVIGRATGIDIDDAIKYLNEIKGTR